jgi:prevent-host-death family protein
MKSVTVTDARRQLSALLEDATTANEPVILQREGEPVGVLMSYRSFESLSSLDRCINQNLLNAPDFRRKLDVSEEQLAAGQVRRHSEVLAAAKG